jgi:hypothetical protein
MTKPSTAPQPARYPPCSLCKYQNGPWCTASKRGMAYCADERRYGFIWSMLFGHCGKLGIKFVRKGGGNGLV